MKKLELTLVVELEDDMFDLNDQDEIDWFKNDVLKEKQLSIFSDYIGDYVGTAIEVKNIKII